MSTGTKVRYKIIDNFLPKDLFIKMKDFMMSAFIPWFYNERVAKIDEKVSSFYFTHTFFSDRYGMSNHYSEIYPILQMIKPEAILRVKGNLYPSTKKLIKYDYHRDYDFNHQGCVFSINTCNGYTQLKDGTKIKSVENRIVFFDPGVEHTATNCTDEQTRININFNFMQKGTL
jgi:hypothetical protein